MKVGSALSKIPPVLGAVTGFCSIRAIAWDRATLHKNFEKWVFPFSGVKDGCEFNGGGLAILRLHFEKLFNLATSCNTLQHLQQFWNFAHGGLSTSWVDLRWWRRAISCSFGDIVIWNLCALGFPSNVFNVLHPDSYKTYLFCEAGLCLSTYSLHCLGKVGFFVGWNFI